VIPQPRETSIVGVSSTGKRDTEDEEKRSKLGPSGNKKKTLRGSGDLSLGGRKH